MTENTMGTGAAKVWKQADNKVILVGEVVENNLEVKEFDTWKDGSITGEKYTAIAGDLTIRTGVNENHKVKFKHKAITNAGGANGFYAGLVTVMNTVVSIADTEKNPDLKPTKVSVEGELELNEYVGHDGKMRSFPQIKGQKVNRLEESDKAEHKAQFDVVGLVGKVIDEIKNDEDTGRKKVTLLVPLWSSVIPLEFVVGEGQGADYVQENFDNGTTVRVYGDIVNFREVKEITVSMGFGADKVDEKITFVQENLIKGGDLYDEDSNASKIIDTGLVKIKLVEREKYLENLKTRATQRQQAGGNSQGGFGGTGGFGQLNTAPKKSEVPEDILKGLF